MSSKTDQRLRLTLRQLEVFVATARAGSTRAAAGQVSRSQSAASTALADLEAVLGTPLFDRVSRRLVLNEHGRLLLPTAVSLLDQCAEVQAQFDEARPAPLRIAASFTIGEYLLPQLVAQWREAHPKSPVRMEIANSSDVIAAIVRFDADVGFLEGQQTHPDVSLRRWREDELVIVCGPSHPLATRRASARALAEATWALREPGSGTREAADRWLLAHLDRVEVGLELGSSEAIKRVAASGLGLACLSRYTVAESLAQGGLVEVRHALPKATRTLSIAVHRHRRVAAATQRFVDHCLRA